MSHKQSEKSGDATQSERQAADAREAQGFSGDETSPPDIATGGGEINELRTRVARWQADYENLRRRSAKELLDARKLAEADFAKAMLAVVDHFEMALSAGSVQADAKSILDGVRITYDELTGILQKRGIESFDPVGEPFDPFCHEAIATEASDRVPPSTVIQTLQRGYKFGDRVLRSAKVKVSVAKGE